MEIKQKTNQKIKVYVQVNDDFDNGNPRFEAFLYFVKKPDGLLDSFSGTYYFDNGFENCNPAGIITESKHKGILDMFGMLLDDTLSISGDYINGSNSEQNVSSILAVEATDLILDFVFDSLQKPKWSYDGERFVMRLRNKYKFIR